MEDPKNEENYPQAVVKEVDGKMVIIDPMAVAMIQAISKHNCESTYEMNLDRVEYFRGRMMERGLSANEYVIVLINVDDPHGGPIADVVMPNYNWDQYRNQGQVPFARGLVKKQFMVDCLKHFDQEASDKLSTVKNKVCVVVVDHQVAEVYFYQKKFKSEK